MDKKVCSKCEQAKELACFSTYTYKGSKKIRANCKDCHRQQCSDWREKNRKHIKQYNQEKYWLDPTSRRNRARNDYHKNIEKNREKARIYASKPENKQRRKEAILKMLSKNPDYYKNIMKEKRSYYNAKAAEYRAIKRNATIHLSENHRKQIEDIYWLASDLRLITGEPYHVDHIVPLQGKNVCGLHVPWNLQILPGDINQSKNNFFDESLAVES